MQLWQKTRHTQHRQMLRVTFPTRCLFCILQVNHAIKTNTVFWLHPIFPLYFHSWPDRIWWRCQHFSNVPHCPWSTWKEVKYQTSAPEQLMTTISNVHLFLLDVWQFKYPPCWTRRLLGNDTSILPLCKGLFQISHRFTQNGLSRCFDQGTVGFCCYYFLFWLSILFSFYWKCFLNIGYFHAFQSSKPSHPCVAQELKSLLFIII